MVVCIIFANSNLTLMKSTTPIQLLLLGILTSFIILTSGCTALSIRWVTDKRIDKQITKLRHKEDNKSVVILPMVHIGTKEYFESVKTTIDTLKEQGYIPYYEGLMIDSTACDSATIDTLIRKSRKIIGLNVFTGYGDKENKSLPRALRRSKKYIAQNNKYLGLSEEDNAIRADYTLHELVAEFERRKGEIPLSECDFSTGLSEKYKCKKDKGSRYTFVHNLRDEHVLDLMKNSPHDKIIIIYGKAHANSMVFNLKKEGYEMTVKGKYIYISK